MYKSVKIKVERLKPEYFAPYGHLINSLEEHRPDIVKGNYSSYEKHAYSEITPDDRKDDPQWYAADKNRTPLSEGLKRAHFAFHTDAGQSFFPENGKPSVYIVGGVGEPLRPEEMRAFCMAHDADVLWTAGNCTRPYEGMWTTTSIQSRSSSTCSRDW